VGGDGVQDEGAFWVGCRCNILIRVLRCNLIAAKICFFYAPSAVREKGIRKANTQGGTGGELCTGENAMFKRKL